ncbi:MAG: RNA chaperone Hfq [Gammaproteobacteria bacterium AqS3]|nr:RNA chaperone Hfq [Gammaproteobacteria bacterium AqS3]
MSKPVNYEAAFLNALRTQEVLVSIYLISGVRLVGEVTSFDSESIFMRGIQSSNQITMIYKKSVSTIRPEGQFKFGD